jgi:hypothetical protein
MTHVKYGAHCALKAHFRIPERQSVAFGVVYQNTLRVAVGIVVLTAAERPEQDAERT